MSELYHKSLIKLELDQVLQLLSECAGSIGGKEACLQLNPTSDLEEVELLLQQTTAASDLCTRNVLLYSIGGSSFYGIRHDYGGGRPLRAPV